jgi:hypothetical protein
LRIYFAAGYAGQLMTVVVPHLGLVAVTIGNESRSSRGGGMPATPFWTRFRA